MEAPKRMISPSRPPQLPILPGDGWRSTKLTAGNAPYSAFPAVVTGRGQEESKRPAGGWSRFLHQFFSLPEYSKTLLTGYDVTMFPGFLGDSQGKKLYFLKEMKAESLILGL